MLCLRPAWVKLNLNKIKVMVGVKVRRPSERLLLTWMALHWSLDRSCLARRHHEPCTKTTRRCWATLDEDALNWDQFKSAPAVCSSVSIPRDYLCDTLFSFRAARKSRCIRRLEADCARPSQYQTSQQSARCISRSIYQLSAVICHRSGQRPKQK